MHFCTCQVDFEVDIMLVNKEIKIYIIYKEDRHTLKTSRRTPNETRYKHVYTISLFMNMKVIYLVLTSSKFIAQHPTPHWSSVNNANRYTNII